MTPHEQRERNEKIACELVDEFRRSLSAEKWTNRNLQGLAVAIASALRECEQRMVDETSESWAKYIESVSENHTGHFSRVLKNIVATMRQYINDRQQAEQGRSGMDDTSR